MCTEHPGVQVMKLQVPGPSVEETSATNGPSQNSGDIHATVKGTGPRAGKGDGRGPAPALGLRVRVPLCRSLGARIRQVQGSPWRQQSSRSCRGPGSQVTKPAARRTPAARGAERPARAGRAHQAPSPGLHGRAPPAPATHPAFSQTEDGNAKRSSPGSPRGRTP